MSTYCQALMSVSFIRLIHIHILYVPATSSSMIGTHGHAHLRKCLSHKTSWRYLLMLAWHITRHLCLDKASCPLHPKNRETWKKHTSVCRLSSTIVLLDWEQILPMKFDCPLQAHAAMGPYTCISVLLCSTVWLIWDVIVAETGIQMGRYRKSLRGYCKPVVAGRTRTGKSYMSILHCNSPSLIVWRHDCW